MFLLRATKFLVLIRLVFALNCSTKPDVDTSINCSIQRKCSLIEDIVWATDSLQCFLYRNPCTFANEMCLRRDKNRAEYQMVTQQECQKYCQGICTKEYAPVCAEYNNELKTFPNRCTFYSYSCQNNKSYVYQNDGECNQAVPA